MTLTEIVKSNGHLFKSSFRAKKNKSDGAVSDVIENLENIKIIIFWSKIAKIRNITKLLLCDICQYILFIYSYIPIFYIYNSSLERSGVV